MEGDEVCVVCSGPPKAPDADCPEWDDSLRSESLNWLNHYVGITKDENLITLGAYLNYSNFAIDDYYQGKPSSFGCATYFREPEGIPWDETTDGPYGLACHQKCYNLLQEELQYKLKFGDVWPLLMQQEFPTNWLDAEVTGYGGMGCYAGEFFRYKQLCEDGNTWMLRDPTAKMMNKERILKVWRALIEKVFPAQKLVALSLLGSPRVSFEVPGIGRSPPYPANVSVHANYTDAISAEPGPHQRPHPRLAKIVHCRTEPFVRRVCRPGFPSNPLRLHASYTTRGAFRHSFEF